MRTPAEAAIYQAERPVYDAARRLDELHAQARALRSGLAAIRIPLDAANDRLDHTDDLAAILISQIASASRIVDAEIDRLQADEEVRYTRAHGLSALAERAANDDDATERTA